MGESDVGDCLTFDVGDMTCHQHIKSPTSVTNIDVTIRRCQNCFSRSKTPINTFQISIALVRLREAY